MKQRKCFVSGVGMNVPRFLPTRPVLIFKYEIYKIVKADTAAARDLVR